MLRRLLPFVRPYWPTGFEAVALLVVTGLLETVAIPLVLASMLIIIVRDPASLAARPPAVPGWNIGDAIAPLTTGRDPLAVLVGLASVGGAIILVKCACDARRQYVTQRFGHLVGRDLRERLFAALLFQPVAFHERQSAAGLLSRVTGDVAGLQERLGAQLFELLHAPVAVAIGITSLVVVDWHLTGATLFLAPAVAWAIARLSARSRRLTVVRHDRLAELNAYVGERLGSIRTIQAFGREADEVAEMARLNRRYFRQSMRVILATDTLSSLSELFALSGMLAAIVVGGMSVVTGRTTAEHFVLFFSIAPMVSSHVGRLARMGPVLHQIVGSTTRVVALLDLVPTVTDAPHAKPLAHFKGRVTFDRVAVRYGHDGAPPALSRVSLDVAPGEVVAIVGPSGAGKTTLVNLIPRFFDPSEGRVFLDGQDLRTLRLASLRAQIGVVAQEPMLFNQSVRENIRYGAPDATEEAVCAAARAANATEFIERLPAGFDTVIGERGVTLSAGQRQRLAIARAVLRDPRILILDEATSALDSENEALIHAAIERIAEGRTTFVIAHRLSTVRRATRIVVLDGGQIVQQGHHAALANQPGLYQRFHGLQSFEPVEERSA